MNDSEKTHYRACHLCEAICGLEIKTSGPSILSIKGDKEDPLSQGHICPKAIALKDLHEDPDRLRQPMLKQGDNWLPISWEKAFDWVADKIHTTQTRHGNDAVAIYAGNPAVHNYGLLTHGAAFSRLLKTKNRFSATSLDQLPMQLSCYWMYGHQMMVPVPDIDRTDFLLIIGGNPVASNGSMWTVPDVSKRLKAIQKRGGEFVVIDPRRTETAAIADAHYFVRPGTDGLFLLAMIHTLFEENLIDRKKLKLKLDNFQHIEPAVKPFTPEAVTDTTGISPETIRQLARKLAKTDKAACYGRMGISAQKYGTLCNWAIQVINILTANLDTEGGTLITHPAFAMVQPGEPGAGSYGRWHSRVSGLPSFGGEIPATVMAEEIQTPGEGQIKGLITLAGNPVLSSPNGQRTDEALSQLDFMVAIDIYMNETTRHADLILPSTSPLEHDHYDIAFHRLAVHNTARYNAPLFSPPEGALHDWQILNGLAQALADQQQIPFKPLPEPSVLIDLGIQSGYYSESRQHCLALTMDKIKQHPHGIDLGPLKPSMSERLCSENGAINMAPSPIIDDIKRLQQEIPAQENSALRLIGRRHIRSNNSWMHNFHRLIKGKPRWHLLMHPNDMANRQLQNGDTVQIHSRAASIQTIVSASDDMMPGVVSLPHGWGHRRQGVELNIASEQQGVSANDITDEQFYDAVSGNAALNGVPVEVERA